MLDHIILTVSDSKRSLAFYEAALNPLKIKLFMPYKGEDGHPDPWGFGDGKKAFFWIKQGQPDPTAIHWGFAAENENKVDQFHEAAMSAGARDNISPRARLEYYPGYYAAEFNSSLEGNVRRAIDIHEGDNIDEKALKALIRAAVALNTSKQAAARPVRSRKRPKSV